MAGKGISHSQQVLLDILRCSLRGEKYQTDKDVNWEEVFQESRLQAVAYQALDAISPSQTIPAGVKDAWMQYAMASVQKNLQVHSEHSFVDRQMTENNIPYCILKGSAAASYYPLPSLRAMGDVDFLVSEEDIPKATQALVSLGFTPWKEDHDCHIVLRKGRQHLEMHFAPAGIPDGKPGEQIRGYLESVFVAAQRVTVEGFSFVRPSAFHHGLILLMHMYHHILSEGIGLRHLCDWGVFVSSLGAETFSALFQEKLTACGLWQFAKIMSGCACYAFSLPQEGFVEDCPLYHELLEDIFCGGNFGVKAPERTNQSRFFSRRGKQGVSRFSFLHLISSMNRTARKQYPVFEKCRILRPFGWIFVGGRYFIKAIFGKRKLPDREFLRQAGDRKELYRKFHLFEVK